MKRTKLEVYDLAMCCSDGGCGEHADPHLARFARDLDWLAGQGVDVERFVLPPDRAAFAAQDCVRTALDEEGVECLPLIVVDGSIAAKGIYPPRSDLMRFVGIGGEAPEREDSAAPPAAACASQCDCAAPSSTSRAKMAVGLVALLAVAGILLFKATNAPQSANPAPQNGSQFAQSIQGNNIGRTDVSREAATAQDGAGTASDKGVEKIGAYLGSLKALDAIAGGKDGVFVFVPARSGQRIAEETAAAVLAAQRSLKTNGVKIGLFTFQTGSPEHSEIASQVELPVVLVAKGGAGLIPVSGEVTETKILQAFIAASNASSCAPGRICGPGGCN